MDGLIQSRRAPKIESKKRFCSKLAIQQEKMKMQCNLFLQYSRNTMLCLDVNSINQN